MNQHNGRELIIEVDDQVEVLIQQINSSSGRQSIDFADSLQKVVIDSILGPFGLSPAMFVDQDGGNITTVHNFEKGISANASDSARYDGYVKAQTETFDRKDYEKPLPSERKEEFKANDNIDDAYTRASLPKDGRAVRDHVVSAHEVEMSSKGHLGQTREERVATANQSENKVWTDRSLNSSKGDRDLLEWADRPNRKDSSLTNAEYYGADLELLKKKHCEAKKAVGRDQNFAVLKKQAGEFMKQGGLEAGKLAFRQVLGLLLKDLAEGLIQDIKALIQHGFESIRQLAEMLKKRLDLTIAGLKEKWADYLKDGAAAGLTGFLSSLVTLLINSLMTTAKNVVTIIREGILAVVRSIKLIVLPEEGMTAADTAYEVMKLLSGALVVAVGLGIQETLAKAISTVPILAPFASEIAAVATAVLTGTAGLLVVLAFDYMKGYLAFQRKQIADLHRGQAVSLLKIKRNVLLIGEAQAFVTATSEQLRLRFRDDWAEMEALDDAASQSIEAYEGSVNELSTILARL